MPLIFPLPCPVPALYQNGTGPVRYGARGEGEGPLHHKGAGQSPEPSPVPYWYRGEGERLVHLSLIVVSGYTTGLNNHPLPTLPPQGGGIVRQKDRRIR